MLENFLIVLFITPVVCCIVTVIIAVGYIISPTFRKEIINDWNRKL